MLSWKNLLPLFVCLCLSFNSAAQVFTDESGQFVIKPGAARIAVNQHKPGIFYALLLKGMPAPYDTTVAIHVTEYRKIRTKVTLADSLVDAKNHELAQAYRIIQEKDSAQNVTLEIARANARANERLTKTNAQLNQDYDALYLEATKSKPLIKRPWFLVTIGAVGGALLKSL